MRLTSLLTTGHPHVLAGVPSGSAAAWQALGHGLMVRMAVTVLLWRLSSRTRHVALALSGIQPRCGPHIGVNQAPLQVFASLLNDRPDLAAGHFSVLVALVRQLQMLFRRFYRL